MTLMLLGQVCTREGHVAKQDSDPYNMPAVSYMRRQAGRIPFCIDHDRSWELGEVQTLERSERCGLLAFGIIEADIASLLEDHGPWYISDSVRCRNVGLMKYGQGRIDELSLVQHTTNHATRPVVWSTDDGQPPMPLFWRDAWDRGVEQARGRRYRKAPDHLDILDLDELSLVDEVLTAPDEARAAARRLRALTRSAPAPKPAQPRGDSLDSRVYRHRVGGTLLSSR